MKLSFSTAALAAALLFHASAAEREEPLARVGEIEILTSDVKPRIDALGEQERAALAANPELLSRYVRTLIAQQLLLREALAAEWDKEPMVEKQLEELREQAITQGFLRTVSAPEKDFPSAAEVESAYEQNREALRLPKQFRLAQIFVALPKDAGKEAGAVAKVRLDEIQAQLKTGDFAAVAREASDEPQSAARGGEIGWLTVEQIQPGIREQIEGLKPGVVSQPIRLDDGFHLVKVLETKEAGIAPLDDVRDALAERLRAARAQEKSEAYMAALLEKNPIALNEIKLGELLPKAPKGSAKN